MKLNLSKSQALKVLKVVGWVAVSSAVGGIISLIAQNPVLFGVFTPIVNVFLVTVLQLVKEPEEL